MSEKGAEYEGWAVCEFMGHRKLAGRIAEEEVARALARRYQPEPVSRYELPPMPAPNGVQDAEVIGTGSPDPMGDLEDDDDHDAEDAF